MVCFNPCLFALVIDEFIRHIQDEVSWCMSFVEDIVLTDETRVGIDYKLELLRKALQSKGFKLDSLN